ncbi:MAG TPA: DegV family protein [Anaerolineae bacterium]|nr:DegV family protein [Anaerolineae bacterium]
MSSTSVKIVSDSGCDLPSDLIARYDITIVPLLFRFGQEIYREGEMDVGLFWQRLMKEPVDTSTPPSGAFAALFERLLAAGHDVVCFTITSKHSSSYNSAWLAAQPFADRVRVVDSLSVSLGTGLQVMEAARAAAAGLSLDEVVVRAKRVRDSLYATFVLNTLETVRRGGRLARIMPLIERAAQVFHVKPVLEIVRGEIKLAATVRTYRRAVQHMEREVLRRWPLVQLAVVHTRRPEEAQALAQRLIAATGLSLESVLVREAGIVLAAHAGSGVLGIAAVQTPGDG